MNRVRHREAHDTEGLRRVYDHEYDHRHGPDHRLRVPATVEIARWMGPFEIVADLSCGDGAVTQALGAPTTILGDLVAGRELCGPIEETLDQIGKVDLFVCSETVEHLDDPDSVLARIRALAAALVVSTPLDEQPGNIEHYWGWDREAVEDMLAKAGWQTTVFGMLSFPGGLTFGIWGCR